jgi:hypothetical protein
MPRAKTAFSGLFWRFLVADDPEVDRYLVRDADSIVNVQERLAIDEWVASGRHFHVMRDFWPHTGLMLAGLWGGVRGALPPHAPQIAALLAKEATRDAREYPERTLDQRFLREVVWPIGAVDFPPYGRRASGRHVGQNESVAQKDQRGRELALLKHEM